MTKYKRDDLGLIGIGTLLLTGHSTHRHRKLQSLPRLDFLRGLHLRRKVDI